MAGIIRNSFLSAAKRLSNPSKILLGTPKAPLYASNNRLLSTKLNGSLWQMNSNNVFTSKTRVACPANCKCCCRKYSAEVDKEMTSLLEDEISLESEKITDLPKFTSFKVTSKEGSQFELEREDKKEKIKVVVNVNASVESSGAPEEGEDEEMICRPDFEVTIEKKGSKDVMSMFCMFDKDDLDEESDLFIIHSVSVYSENAEDTTYSLQAENLDPDLYRMFFEYLEDRKLDKDFAYELIDYATVYEQSKYLEFLGNVKKFVSTKN